MTVERKTIALIVTTMGSFLTPFDGSSVSIAAKAIQTEFGMSAVALAWVANAFLLSAAIFLLPWGKIGDICGRKKVFVGGIVVFTVASGLCAVSNSGSMLILMRVFQGMGGAMLFGTGVAILTSAYPARERGKALGINVAAVYLGLTMGPVLGGLITDYIGWRFIFSVNIPLGILLILLVAWKLHGDDAPAQESHFDMTGAVVYGLALVSVMYGVSKLTTLPGDLLFAAGLLGLLGFYLWENSRKDPLMDMNLFRKNTVFAFSNLAALINYSATFAVTFLLSLYLQYIKVLDPKTAGLVLVAQPLAMFVFSPWAGRLSDRTEPRIVASAGMALTSVGLVFLAFTGSGTSAGHVTAVLLVLGLGFALFSSPNTNAVMSSIDRRNYGVGSATLATMRLVGQMLSLGIVTLILSIYMGSQAIAPQNYPALMSSISVAFAVFSILCFVGIFASLARGKVRSAQAGDHLI